MAVWMVAVKVLMMMDTVKVQPAELDVPTKRPTVLIVRSLENGSRSDRPGAATEVTDNVVRAVYGVWTTTARRTGVLAQKGLEEVCHQNGIAIAISKTGPSRPDFGWQLLGLKVIPKAR
jgi:hypothetical protein